jgi:hypothetical protein
MYVTCSTRIRLKRYPRRTCPHHQVLSPTTTGDAVVDQAFNRVEHPTLHRAYSAPCSLGRLAREAERSCLRVVAAGRRSDHCRKKPQERRPRAGSPRAHPGRTPPVRAASRRQQAVRGRKLPLSPQSSPRTATSAACRVQSSDRCSNLVRPPSRRSSGGSPAKSTSTRGRPARELHQHRQGHDEREGDE